MWMCRTGRRRRNNRLPLNPTLSNQIKPNAKTHPDEPIYEYCAGALLCRALAKKLC